MCASSFSRTRGWWSLEPNQQNQGVCWTSSLDVDENQRHHLRVTDVIQVIGHRHGEDMNEIVYNGLCDNVFDTQDVEV